MSLFSQAAFHISRSPSANNGHDYTSVIRRLREEPKENNVTSLRMLAGRSFVQEAHLFFEELQAGLSSISIQSRNSDEFWCMLDWHRYILTLWTKEFKDTSGVIDSKWMDIVEGWTTIIRATLAPILNNALPSNSHQRPTLRDGTDSLSFEKSLANPQHRIGLHINEEAMVHAIVAATRGKAWDTTLYHWLAFTDEINSVRKDLEQTQLSYDANRQRRFGIESSRFDDFILVLAEEIKSLLDLLPPKSQDLLHEAFTRALCKALSHPWHDYTVRSLKFHHTLMSRWPSDNPILEIELETVFQERVQETFGNIVRPYISENYPSAPYTVKDLEDIIALGADIHGKVKEYWNCSLWVAAGSAASFDIFKALVHAGAPYTNDFGDSSPLHAAAEAGNLDIVAFLLGKKQHNFNVGVNDMDASHQTSLHRAAEAGNEAVVSFLLNQHDIEVNCRDRLGDTPFLLAIQSTTSNESKKCATIKALLRDPRVDRNPEPRGGYMPLPLHLAAESQDASLRLIVRHVRGINIQDGDGSTPLHKAVEGNSGSKVEILLQNGADPTLTNKDGLTPLLLACNKRHLGPMKILLRLPSAFTAQCPFPVQGELGLFRPRPGDEHFSPVTLVLHDISEFGKSRMAHVGFALNVILAAKPDLEVRDAEGRSVLNRVINFINESMLEDLLRAGADVNSQDDRGRTPLHRFFGSCEEKKYKLLFAYGADPDLRDEYGE